MRVSPHTNSALLRLWLPWSRTAPPVSAAASSMPRPVACVDMACSRRRLAASCSADTTGWTVLLCAARSSCFYLSLTCRGLSAGHPTCVAPISRTTGSMYNLFVGIASSFQGFPRSQPDSQIALPVPDEAALHCHTSRHDTVSPVIRLDRGDKDRLLLATILIQAEVYLRRSNSLPTHSPLPVRPQV